MASPIPEHRGDRAAALGRRIKALLAPLESVCRYRERIGEDSARFEVRPSNPAALAFMLAIAPGGINLDCAAFSIKELPIEEDAMAQALVAAILAGRVRELRRIGRGGAPRAAKAYVFDAEGRLLFKNRKSSLLALLPGPRRIERRRFAAYA